MAFRFKFMARRAAQVQERPVVFLHIPKTAGQTVSHQIGSLVGLRNMSPIRDIAQAGPGQTHLPEGYRFYAGHIDWTDLDQLDNPFVFTILRDPRERIGSLYFYLLREAQKRTPEELKSDQYMGQRVILESSAEEYFFGGSRLWQRFIRNNYDNFCCTYLATQRVRGSAELDGIGREERMQRALAGARRLDAIYPMDRLEDLEDDMQKLFGTRISIVGNYANTSEWDVAQSRWTKLLELFETDAARSRLNDFVEADMALMAALGIDTTRR